MLNERRQDGIPHPVQTVCPLPLNSMDEKNMGATAPLRRGQALVEYSLILAMLAISFGGVLYLTGPAIGNVFCNVVYNISGENANVCGGTDEVLSEEGGRPNLFWQTVTWVAENRQGETPFPTPILRPPVAAARDVRSATPTQTFTPSSTSTNTITPSPTATASPGPSPTPSDLTFTVPHVDQMNKQAWWRIDQYNSSEPLLFGNDLWDVTWYDSITGSSKSTFALTSQVGVGTLPASTSLNYPSSSTIPVGAIGLTSANTFGAEFTRDIVLPTATTFVFSLRTDDYGRLYVDGTLRLQINNADGTQTVNVSLTAGSHTIRLQWAENSGNARFIYSMTPLNANNPDDTSTASACRWGQETDDSNSGSRVFLMDENPSSNTWTAGNSCNLELRGSVDLSTSTNPVLSFWDYWDFGSGATASVQVGNYVLNAGVLDRSAFNWCTLNLHSASTANYNWTRNQINIKSQCPSLGNSVTFRFVAGSASSGTLRWRIDDIQILDVPASTTTYTIGDYWNLNSRTQMSDFVFNADSDYAVSDLYPSLDQNPSSARRWDLTSNISRDGTAWDDSPGANYPLPTTLDTANSPYRIHYLEFKHDIDITTARTAALGTDYEGDTGVPILSFWFAYDVPVGASVRVQYSRAARNRSALPDATNPDSWVDVTGGMLLDYVVPVTPLLNEQTARTDTAMQLIEIPLTAVPNYDTQSFRLRIALYTTQRYPLGGAASTAGDGIYVDDLRIERLSTVGYIGYPFTDEAEDSLLMSTYWLTTGSNPRWGQVGSPLVGALGTASSYGDSPGANYGANTSTSLQLRRMIDLQNDTPENTVDAVGRAAAVDPQLTFYFKRQVNGAAINFAVDLYSPITNQWDEIWLYDSAADTSYRTQSTWERVEISLSYALATVTGTPWATITSDANAYNDDFRVRFRFKTGNDITADGVYIDQIDIKNAPTTTHRLWATTTTTAFGTGGGPLEDSFDFVSPTVVTGSWQGRWYGADWAQTSAAGYVRRGSIALSDSLAGEYTVNTRNILEFLPIIDLRSTSTNQLARLYFWTRYAIDDNDNFRVEIAYEDSANTSLGYDKLAGWSAWTAVNTSVTGTSAVEKTSTEVANWVREDVNLASFLGKRIRVRFVMNVPNNTNEADGAYIDDVTFTYGYNTIALTFTEDAQTLSRWVTEGSWGVTEQYFAGTGTDAADLGNINWVGWYYDCESNGGACDSTWGDNVGSYMNSILNNYQHTLASPVLIPNRIIGPETTANISYVFTDTYTPINNSAGPAFNDDFGARWIRQVALNPGLYNFQTLSDDGVRLWINDVAGTSTPVAGDTGLPASMLATAGYIINQWSNHSTQLDYGQLTVTSPTSLPPRYLYLDYFENGGNSIIALSAARDTYSITDSPNTRNGSGWDIVPSTVPGNVSLMLNGFMNFSNVASNYNMQYLRMYDSDTNNAFYLEVSTDGGFTWNAIASETLTGSESPNIRPINDWQTRTVNLNAYRSVANTAVTFRFRVDSRSASTGGDGYYITDILVIQN